MASPPPQSPPSADVATAEEFWKQQLRKRSRGHEVAVAEIESLPATRAVYQKSGNIYFLKNVKTALAAEKKQLENIKGPDAGAKYGLRPLEIQDEYCRTLQTYVLHTNGY